MTPFGKKRRKKLKKTYYGKKKHKAYNFKKVKKKTTLEELNPTNYLLSAQRCFTVKVEKRVLEACFLDASKSKKPSRSVE